MEVTSIPIDRFIFGVFVCSSECPFGHLPICEPVRLSAHQLTCQSVPKRSIVHLSIRLSVCKWSEGKQAFVRIVFVQKTEFLKAHTDLFLWMKKVMNAKQSFHQITGDVF
jgi:hypothetical protein